jgi:hypothetical protein
MLTCPARCWKSFGCSLRVSTIVEQLCTSTDTSLTPPGAQYSATLGKVRQRKCPKYTGSASLVKSLQRVTDHS